MAGVLFYFWKNSVFRDPSVVTLTAGMPKQPILLAFTSALCAVISVFLGIFLAGQSHVFEFRWLRPVGAWLMGGASVMLLSMISSILAGVGYGVFLDRAFCPDRSVCGNVFEFYQRILPSPESGGGASCI